MNTERTLLELIATDRIYVPVSSMSGKLDRSRPKLAKAAASSFNKRYQGERAYARVEEADIMKARGMKQGIEEFKAQYPKYGQILQDLIDEERSAREIHMYFGTREGCLITADDYRNVMTNLGFTPNEAEQLYPRLMEISRKLSRKRGETERRILIG